jgi:Pentapeptide repeats (8 copies)
MADPVDAPAPPAAPIGRRLEFIDMVGARLDGADLQGARLSHVNLAGASLRGARLDHAQFLHVDASGACFAGAKGAFHADRSTFRNADFSDASLEGASWFGCSFDKASFDRADLSRAVVGYCTAKEASFHSCKMMWLHSRGTSYEGADLTHARSFFISREIVIEIVRRALGSDIHAIQLLGQLAYDDRWCYPEWKSYLEKSPMLWDLALAIFARYPESGCAQALQRGWRPPELARAG